MLNENFKYIAAAVGVVGLSIGAVIYISMRDKTVPPTQPPPTAVSTPPPAAVPEDPAVKHPLPEPEVQEPLPPLDESDAPMKGALESLIGKDPLEQFVVSKDLVRHIVVTVDNLSSEKVAERVRPLKATPGRFAVAGSEDAPVLDPANYERYKQQVQLFRSLDSKLLVATYTRYYPLFQESYESLGHPPEYFNDRVIEVIDHLLATPEVPDPIVLAQPGVQYEFADPKLEALSAGQKVLIRMGRANATALKEKLRELRGELVAKQPPK
jgi:hypothetical protein